MLLHQVFRMPMGQSLDLYQWVVIAMAESVWPRKVAERFGDSPASAIRWQEGFERRGGMAAKPEFGDRRSQHRAAQVALILGLSFGDRHSRWRNCTLVAQRGISTSACGLSRFVWRHAATCKNHHPDRRAALADVKAAIALYKRSV